MDFKEFKTFGCSIEPLRVRLVLQYIGMSVAIADDEPIASISYEFLFSGALFLSAVAGATPRAYRMKIANGLQIPCKVPASTLPFADLCVAQLGHLSGDIADDELIIGRFSVASAAETRLARALEGARSSI